MCGTKSYNVLGMRLNGCGIALMFTLVFLCTLAGILLLTTEPETSHCYGYKYTYDAYSYCTDYKPGIYLVSFAGILLFILLAAFTKGNWITSTQQTRGLQGQVNTGFAPIPTVMPSAGAPMMVPQMGFVQQPYIQQQQQHQQQQQQQGAHVVNMNQNQGIPPVAPPSYSK